MSSFNHPINYKPGNIGSVKDVESWYNDPIWKSTVPVSNLEALTVLAKGDMDWIKRRSCERGIPVIGYRRDGEDYYVFFADLSHMRFEYGRF